MTIQRLQVTLDGGSMGSGVATHYATPGGGCQPLLKAFWTSVASIMSGYVHIHVPNEGEEFDEATGALTGVWTFGTPVDITGGGTGAYAGGVGAAVGWSTSGIHYARKVRGRTFIVPLAANTYDTDGTLSAGTRTTLNNAANTLVSGAAGSLRIWCRPDPDRPIGAAFPITGGLVKDHVSWLKSRR
jgi:hypothetical protein